LPEPGWFGITSSPDGHGLVSVVSVGVVPVVPVSVVVVVAVVVGVVVVGVVVVSVDVVVGVVSVVVAHVEPSGEQELSAAAPPATGASTAARQRIKRAGRAPLGTLSKIDDTVRRCVGLS
jgi:hypothetical protein